MVPLTASIESKEKAQLAEPQLLLAMGPAEYSMPCLKHDQWLQDLGAFDRRGSRKIRLSRQARQGAQECHERKRPIEGA